MLSIFRSTTATMILTAIMFIGIAFSFEGTRNDILFTVDEVNTVVQGLNGVTASDIGRGVINGTLDGLGNLTKGIFNYIMQDLNSSKATKGLDVIFSNAGQITGLGSDFNSFVDGFVDAMKKYI